jgi:isoaspartyl peptidase/L-asparaginase-like protein (Ntn-hydrolase superfamily)
MAVKKAQPPKKIAPMIVSSGNGRGALPAGIRILEKGGSALDAVDACARIVDGTTHLAGSVAALSGFLHPITVARGVMEKLPHVMLVGAGAARFAREIGAEEADLLWSRLNIVVLAASGEHAATTTKRGVWYAYQSVGQSCAALRPRMIVRRRSR